MEELETENRLLSSELHTLSDEVVETERRRACAAELHEMFATRGAAGVGHRCTV